MLCAAKSAYKERSDIWEEWCDGEARCELGACQAERLAPLPF
jgi:hypothetical protein